MGPQVRRLSIDAAKLVCVTARPQKMAKPKRPARPKLARPPETIEPAMRPVPEPPRPPKINSPPTVIRVPDSWKPSELKGGTALLEFLHAATGKTRAKILTDALRKHISTLGLDDDYARWPAQVIQGARMTSARPVSYDQSWIIPDRRLPRPERFAVAFMEFLFSTLRYPTRRASDILESTITLAHRCLTLDEDPFAAKRAQVHMNSVIKNLRNMLTCPPIASINGD